MQPVRPRGLSLWMVVFLVIMFVFIVMQLTMPPTASSQFTYTNLLQAIGENRVMGITITPSNLVQNVGVAEVRLAGGQTHTVNIPNLDVFVNHLHQNLNYPLFQIDANPPPRPSIIMQMLPFLLIAGVMILVIFIVMSQAAGGGGRGNMQFGKSRAKVELPDERRVSFEQVAGLEEEKEDLAEIVDFLKAPGKYKDIGARIPRGVLLVGPPGTGKTYLARAVAGEAKVPFYSISGSDFVEMFVGVGAARVRDLFEQAKRNPASIVIIDEIDAVGRRRGAGLGGGHDEREQTLNQLLVEMDGFDVNAGVIVLAATNRPDILDPALLRPGRFDRQIVVNRPDVKGREAVLNVHAQGKQISADVSLKVVAQTTAGFTPADLENLLNEAALLAARENKLAIDMDSLRRAFIKVGVGTEKKSRVITEKERRVTAYHEAGHAICYELLPLLERTYMISVIPTGRAGGYVMPQSSEDRTTMAKTYMQERIVSLMGGRAAEQIAFNDITTGAANDIERATTMARDMVVKFGMSDMLGPIQFGSENEEVFLGRDLAHTRNYGEQVADTIDAEIKRIVETAYNQAMSLIRSNLETLHKIVDLLMEKERVTGDEVRDLFPLGSIVAKDVSEGLLVGG